MHLHTNTKMENVAFLFLRSKLTQYMPTTACPAVMKTKLQHDGNKCVLHKQHECKVLAGKDFTYIKSVICKFGNLIYLTTIINNLSLLIDNISKHGDTIFNEMS